jgi:hypothetical protein
MGRALNKATAGLLVEERSAPAVTATLRGLAETAGTVASA